ncbi:MAG: hypothetical protein ACLFR2_05830 [Candidatus Kapaibacterium sp.]
MRMNHKFDDRYFDDIPPAEKSWEQLIARVLEDASGRRPLGREYTPGEVNYCARKLIMGGFLRGTVFGLHNCSWSRPTQKGFRYLELLKLNAAESR